MNRDEELPAGRAPASRIDLAIDRAVREMMEFDPPAGLRRRVLARLQAPQRRAWLVPAWGMAAAAAVLILAALVLRPGAPAPLPQEQFATQRIPLPVQPATESVPAGIQPPEAPASASAAKPLRPATAGPVRREALAPPPHMDTVFGNPDRRVAAANVPAAAPAPLEAAAPEAIAVGGLTPLRISDITIAPLQVEPIRLAPLAPPR